MKTVLLIVAYVILNANAEPHPCCKNNATVYQFKCTDHGELWINKACPFNAYPVGPEDFQLNYDDTLQLLPNLGVIGRDEYCVMVMDDEPAAMICFPEAEELAESTQITYLGIIICSSISIISLVMTLFVYIVLPNLRDIQGKCMMFTIFSLMMAFIFLAVLQDSQSESACAALAFVLYFWFMCTFFWLNVVSFNVWRSVVKPKLLSNKNYLFYMYNAYGWGAPLLMLAILIICHHTDGGHIKPRMGETRCWFKDSTAVRAYFYGPICALLILNIIMFISTAVTLSKQTVNVPERKYRSHRYKMCLYLKLFIVMGICWIFEPMSEFLRVDGKYLWIVTDYINCLQGLIIFLLLVVFRKRVRRDLAKKGGLCCRGLPKEWATIADEECEELEEEVDELSVDNEAPVVQRSTVNV